MRTLWTDVRYALRQMGAAPVFALTVVLVLGLGIGATTAIFSLVHAVMLKSLPVMEPERLYQIGAGEDPSPPHFETSGAGSAHWPDIPG